MTLRWAIMGTGRIATAFADALTAEGHACVAVGSGDAQRAAAFAERYDIPHHGHHHDVLAHEPDAVYVATTNERHHTDALACIDAGVPTLVEKPFALDTARTEQVLAHARDRGVFVMEAMWMLVQPGYLEARRRIEAGDLGEVRLVTADFGINLDGDPERADPARRWLAREQGGGALLDVGIYPLTFTISLLGAPTEMHALGQLGPTEVDVAVSAAMRHPGGLSSWSCSYTVDSGVEATVAGTEGSLRLHAPFHHSPTLTLRRGADTVETIDVPDAALGYQHEIREVARCLDARLLESPAVPHDQTVTVMQCLDELRAQLEVSYPG